MGNCALLYPQLTLKGPPVTYLATAGGRRAVLDKRSLSRKRVLKTAQIILSDKAPKLDCSVRNISTAGACLQVSTTYGIPASFDVIIEGARRSCRSVWRSDTKLGVTFL